MFCNFRNLYDLSCSSSFRSCFVLNSLRAFYYNNNSNKIIYKKIMKEAYTHKQLCHKVVDSRKFHTFWLFKSQKLRCLRMSNMLSCHAQSISSTSQKVASSAVLNTLMKVICRVKSVVEMLEEESTANTMSVFLDLQSVSRK